MRCWAKAFVVAHLLNFSSSHLLKNYGENL